MKALFLVNDDVTGEPWDNQKPDEYYIIQRQLNQE